MSQLPKVMLALLALFAVGSALPAGAAPSERRMALVIGNGAYRSGTLATVANDAGLIAQTLKAAGFDVTGARDLDEDSLRHAFRDFVDNASKAGPDTVVAVYFAGYGLQLEGENYLLPIDANIARAADLPNRALPLSEYTRALAALRLKAAIVVVDAARASPFSLSGQPLAGGLAWLESEPGMLLAFNATPGTVAPEGREGYGPYARALAEMIREGGLQPANVFDRVRLRVNEMTKGAQVPWDASRIEGQFVFFERGPGAPQPAASPERIASMRSRPMSVLGAEDAYMVALLRDTFDGYADFLAAYPRDPMAKRMRAILAARREAITWRRTCQADTPEASWSYLKRYPRGPHATDARRLLAHLSAGLEPPPTFTMIDYDMPTPLPEELEFFERPVLVFDDPVLAFAPPPPSPVYFLEPPPPELVELKSPPPPAGAHTLPVPLFPPVPVYASVPAHGVESSAPNLPHGPDGGANAPPVGPAVPPAGEQAALIDGLSPAPAAANPPTTGGIKLPPGLPLSTMSPSSPLPTGNQLPSIPFAATFSSPATSSALLSKPPIVPLAPPARGNIPLPIPRAATFSPPTTGNLAVSNPPSTMLVPLATGNIPLPIPRAATLSSPAADNRPSPAPPARTLSPPPTGNKPLPNPPASLAPPAPVHRAAPPTSSVVHQAEPAVIHQTASPPPKVPQPAQPATVVVRQAPPPIPRPAKNDAQDTSTR
jgi:uncharacterized caspase-like protein